MPELTLPSPVAPSPSPAMSAAAGSANAATAADGATPAAGADNGAATPFAAVLQKQIAQQPADAAAARDVQALLASLQAETAKTEEIPVDAISLLAPMLAGIVPVKALAETEAETESAAASDIVAASDTAPVAIAAPAVAAVATAPKLAVTPETESAPETSASIDPSAGRDLQDPAASANIAVAATEGEEQAATGKKAAHDTGFNALLDAAAIKAGEAVQRAASTSATTTAKPVEVVATPVGAHGWSDEVGDKLAWMVGRKESRADLVLTPPSLGRVEVSITVSGDQASASFVTASPAAREALENAVPRLREILQDAGITLGQAQVGAESFRQQAQGDESGDNRQRNNGLDTGDGVATAASATGAAPSSWLRRGNGLVDLFA